ncbi:non-hydrolyzing UDP-N-acetylglucosamine 2-epimerase [Rickettsia prowazekii]|uniref:UDP-N-acetylglucosamine2-epimerase n=2 Tax=Rickettsia prowazekii TaxID=782 RepID=D5AWR7_RICPP|nr:UDP-N-acetylglucosamine 2-epimerase (non-hydrolyzing) [Rickettsia prowazekii]EOB09698.1 UDP-N-acetylglucosamine 2-epimerase [Rickettsia prowazekii str. GvF12]ADE29856.1 UDP-N-acetylglucosamine2-epimerase [Rickettsia prowazekii str. Rp22]AFE49150.1 UDP-N-acetylglucosamine 2-epimerase [Rickettsia prowazekii str. Chernikova]AFE49996.1 UDP-N-acetylglucosamine 2-epimerase [Rickettsia prowazekii str. Katsinyian]AFE51679.1 UDP-N-acetylglucosamine 2-epimerase [Rickettsia prowazekii str. Dachau]
MLKVMTILGTRPELIKMCLVISEFDKYTNHILVHTGQNYAYELNHVFFDDMGIRKPDYFLEIASDNTAKSIGIVIAKVDEVLEKEKPDAVLFYGDTNSCLSAIAAKRRKIPIFHMEAGNRCFDQRVPEEINRKIIDHISDVNITLTEHARRYLISEGFPPERILKSGSHMPEVLNHFMPKILKSDILEKLLLKAKQYFLISSHREENVDVKNNLQDLLSSLQILIQEYNYPIIFSTHPRTKKRLKDLECFQELEDKIRFLPPFSFTDYVKLQINAFCILSDSGTLTEEASILNLPALNIREAHERPEGMDAGTLIMSGFKAERILQSVKVITAQHKNNKCLQNIVSDYAEASIVSKKILRIVLSYVDYVNRTVWFK